MRSQVLLVELVDRCLVGRERGVVHGDIEAAVLLDRGGDHGLDLLALRDVDLDERGFAAIGDDVVDDGLALLLVEVGDDDLRAGLGEEAGRGLAHALCSAGDDGDLVLENGVCHEVFLSCAGPSRTRVAPLDPTPVWQPYSMHTNISRWGCE